MSFQPAPLWKQLAALWVVTVALDVGLLWLQLHRLGKFYWLIPYPTWRLLWPDWGALFRAAPFLGMVLILSLLALGATLALCAPAAASLVHRARPRGKQARAAV
ncbi:hypothetical protein J421_5365 (plasmid) [Gemmatirosa kalamazoonensis]|uniref:Uncharacterized protein n=1 Tax=Gemmatirosa kalamazoonensis TaxID=861299 RepID=W0RRF5_9BACT|nr:hypothetical protein [Gemmatirosa kalamazoonensis]AHG92900.1 hypothetical protein J421_5365 [Gemmatirosa kalamazoonensis]